MTGAERTGLHRRTSRTPIAQTVEKTLQLLDYFGVDAHEMTASEIARRADLPMSTVFRLLSTLTRMRFLDQDPMSRRYRLGLRLLELGYVVQQQLDLPRLAAPILQELALKAEETAHLSVRDGHEGVFIAKAESSQSVRFHTPLGRRVPLHAGASMKIILAFQTDEEIRSYVSRSKLRPMTSRTITDEERLWREVRRIRERGYAVSVGEQTDGAAGIGAPVRDHTGQVVAGLTISGPEQRFSSERIKQYTHQVTAAAVALSVRLGYRQGVAAQKAP